MIEFNCKKKGSGRWHAVRAAIPSIAAQIFAEDPLSGIDDGAAIEVQDCGIYIASFTVVITKEI